jgi:iron-sulfur cluster repair protein YtfE (RIC family)
MSQGFKDVLARISEEHETLLPLVMEIQRTAEARDIPALLKNLANGREALTTELDAHIALEEDDAFALIEQVVGEGFVAPFRAEHKEIFTLRDKVLAGADAGSIPLNLCLELCDLIHEHMQREDAMLFPSARDALAL